MPWQIELFGEVFREGDLTLQQHADLEIATKVRYGTLAWALDPAHLEAHALLDVGSVLLADRKGMSAEEARKEIGALRHAEFEAAVSIYDDDTPSAYSDGFPQSVDEPSTPS